MWEILECQQPSPILRHFLITRIHVCSRVDRSPCPWRWRRYNRQDAYRMQL